MSRAEVDAELARSILACPDERGAGRRRPPDRRLRRRPGAARRGRRADVLLPGRRPLLAEAGRERSRALRHPGQRARPGRTAPSAVAHPDPHRPARPRPARELHLLRRGAPRRSTRPRLRACSAAAAASQCRVPLAAFRSPALTAQPRLPPARPRARQRLPSRGPRPGRRTHAPAHRAEQLLDARLSDLHHARRRAHLDRPRGRHTGRRCGSPAPPAASRSWACCCAGSCTPASAEVRR